MTVRHDDEEPPGTSRLHVVPDQPQALPAHTNPPAEMAVLGAILTTPQLAEQLTSQLTGSDFYQPRHELIWEAIQAVTNTGTLPDPITVGSHLNNHGDLTKIGGAPYLHDLMVACPIAAQAGIYAHDVRQAAKLRRGRAIAMRMIQMADAGAADTIDHSLGAMVDELDKIAADFGPTQTHAPTGIRDLTWLLTGQFPHIDPPTWGRRQDGHALFYAARVNGIYGDPEAAKTWLAKKTCIEAINNHQLAVVVDVDHNGQQLTVAHMLLLGARPADLANPNLFRYYEPDDKQELEAAITDIVTQQPAVVILDSIGEMLPMLGVKSVDNDEITAALRTIASPPARAGACVITIDHLPKSHEARTTGFAIGGTAKKRALDGSLIHAEVRLQPAPGQLGKITLRIEKDRPGELRKTCNGKYIGDFILDSRQENATYATIQQTNAITEEGVFRPTHLMETVSHFIEDLPECTGRQVTDSVRGKTSVVRAAIQQLINEGYVAATVSGKSIRHRSITPYREAEDDQI